MKIVSWNCARGPLDTKLKALDTQQADVAILCEAPPAQESDQVKWFPSEGAPHLKLGVQVRVRGSYKLVSNGADHTGLPHCVNPVRVVGPLSFQLFAVWTWPAPSYVGAFANALEAYDDLIAKGQVVIAGDFNGNPRDDKSRQRIKWTDQFARLRRNQLVSAYHYQRGCAFGEEPEMTYVQRHGMHKGFHIDYCFIPTAWAAHAKCSLGEAGSPCRMQSDHAPVIVDVDEEGLKPQ